MNEPWSKKHKKDFQDARFSLSNSFAQPLSMPELVQLTADRKDADLLEEYQNHDLVYTPNGGSEDLRQAIADLYDCPSVITKDHVLVFPGGQVAIQVAAQAFASNNNCHSIVFVPGYQSTVESPEWVNGNGITNGITNSVTRLRRRSSQKWQIDLEAVRASITSETRYMVINEPHNPSGLVMPRTTQTALVELCRSHTPPIVVLSDEVYRLLEHHPSSRIPAMAEAYPEAGISCVSMSKPWGACGISVGWLVCANKKMIATLWDHQYFGTACVGRASELQAIMVLRSSEAILEDRISIILKNKALLQQVIEETYPDLFGWVRPNAGAIAFVEFKGPLTSLELGNLLASQGISIKPAYCFGFGENSGSNNSNSNVHDNIHGDSDYSDFENHFRIGFGERKMPLALNAFVEVVEEFKDQWREKMTNKAKQSK